MADSFNTLAQLVVLNDKNGIDNGASDLFIDAPLSRVIAAGPASNGTLHKYVKETTAPTVGFRAANDGLDNSPSGDSLVTATLTILDASFVVDKAIADSYQFGTDAYLAREAKKHLRAAIFANEKQMLQGTVTASGGTAAGYVGLADGMNSLGTYVISAGGTTATTGSSIWLIRHNHEGDVMAIMGNDGVIRVDPYVVTQFLGANSKRLSGYHVPITAYAGIALGAAASVVRIANCTADAGKGATDLLISKALALFPAARQPNVIAMGRRSLQQLQASRTATNSTGAPAPFPQESFGVPIVVTDAIGATEALLT